MSFKTVTQWLGLSTFDPKLGLNEPSIFFKVYSILFGHNITIIEFISIVQNMKSSTAGAGQMTTITC